VFQCHTVVLGIRLEECDIVQTILWGESAVPKGSRVVVAELKQTPQIPRVETLALADGKLNHVTLATSFVGLYHLAVEIAVPFELGA